MLRSEGAEQEPQHRGMHEGPWKHRILPVELKAEIERALLQDTCTNKMAFEGTFKMNKDSSDKQSKKTGICKMETIIHMKITKTSARQY